MCRKHWKIEYIQLNWTKLLNIPCYHEWRGNAVDMRPCGTWGWHRLSTLHSVDWEALAFDHNLQSYTVNQDYSSYGQLRMPNKKIQNVSEKSSLKLKANTLHSQSVWTKIKVSNHHTHSLVSQPICFAWTV